MIDLRIDGKELAALRGKHIKSAIDRAMRKASRPSLRDMKREASKRIRARKRLKVKDVNKALVQRRNAGKTIDSMSWGIDMRGDRVPLSAYPHRQVKKGVSVEVNKGQRTLLKSAFVATMKSGHKGIFVRRGAARFPIVEKPGSRPVDALLHAGEAERVADRGRASLSNNFNSFLKAELDKG